MRVPLATKAAALVTAGTLLAAAVVVHVSASVPGDTTYGLKEAVVELRTALASSGEERSSRYLDEVDSNITELNSLTREGAPEEKVEEAAERAVTTERHAQAELSDQSPAPQAAQRYRQHRQNLTNTLKRTNQPAVRDSIQQVLQVLP